MSNIRTCAIAITLAAATIAAATPSFAQTTRAQRAAQMAAQNRDVSDSYALQYNGQQRIAPDGFPVPAAVLNSPNGCWMDDGYGRWTSCESAGGGS